MNQNLEKILREVSEREQELFRMLDTLKEKNEQMFQNYAKKVKEYKPILMERYINERSTT